MRGSVFLVCLALLPARGFAEHEHGEEEPAVDSQSAPQGQKKSTPKGNPNASPKALHDSHHAGIGTPESDAGYVPEDRPATPAEVAAMDAKHQQLDAMLNRMRDMPFRGPTVEALREIARKTDGALHQYRKECETAGPGKEIMLSAVSKLTAAVGATGDLVTNARSLAMVNWKLNRASEPERSRLMQEGARLNQAIYAAMDRSRMPSEFHYKDGFGVMANGSPHDIGPDLQKLGVDPNGFKPHLRDMNQQNPTAPGYNYTARMRAKMKDHAGAEEDASNALEIDPRNAEALSIRAAARYEQENFSGALADARGALAIDPGNENARGTAIYAANRLGQELAAPKAANPFGAGDGGANLGGSSGIAGPIAANNTPEGRQSAALVNDAMRAFQIKDMAAARAALDKAIEVNPANADAHAKRAWLNSREGRTADALAGVKSVLRLDQRKGPGMATKLAADLNKQGRYAEAKEVLGLLRPEQRDAESWYQLARAERGLGDRDAMMANLKRAAELDPASYGAKYQQAMSAGVDEDLAFLFGDERGDGRASGGAKGKGSGNRMLLTSLAVVVGGFLVALGLLHIITAQWTRRFTTRIRMALGGMSEAEVGVTPVEERDAAVGQPPAPSIAGTYELVRQIGLGGMGIVYECVDRGLGRRVAVKKMREEIRVDPRERERFITEARTVANLKHPNIVEIHSIVEDGADLFLVFEFVEGTTLYELLDRRGRLTLAEATRIVEQAGEALVYAHKRDVIHRDLKPSNIMLGDGGVVKVMDFGVARQAKDAVSKLSMTNTIVGTPPYMAPEQEQGLVCKESDVYALAVCFYELVTGRLPFQGSGAGMLLNKMNKSYAPPSTLAPELPAALDQVFAKAFEPEPPRRFRTVAEFLSALRGVRA